MLAFLPFRSSLKENFHKIGMPEDNKFRLLLDNCTVCTHEFELQSGNISVLYLPPEMPDKTVCTVHTHTHAHPHRKKKEHGMLLTSMNVCDIFTSYLIRGGHFCSLLEDMPYYGSK